MNTRTKQLLLILFLAVVIPTLLLGGYPKKVHVMQGETEQEHSTSNIKMPEKDNEIFISILKDSDGQIMKLSLEEYILGVVLAEMPTEFELEALKAQAVVARTYALRRIELGSKHFSAAVCTDSTCCQGYCTKENYLSSGGKEEALEKVSNAVLDTSGLVLTYNDVLAEATYFSCSGGRTEDAQAVWGTDVPYLTVVDSPGEENAAHYTDTITLSSAEFQNKLGEELAGNPSSWVGAITYTKGGGVDTISLAGNEYKGTLLRKKLGLRSTAFVITAVGSNITITTKGFGHRVGMSQYGADAMALKGETYQQILSHYYPGTELKIQDK